MAKLLYKLLVWYEVKMNKNEECLLLFLKNPGRLDNSTDKLKKFIFFINNTNIIINEKNLHKSYIH